MSTDPRSDWPLPSLPPVDFKEGDVYGAQGYADGIIQYASFQGERDYQEDHFVMKSGAKIYSSADAVTALAAIFKAVADDMRNMVPGSTATAAVITPDRVLNVAYIGDSPLMILTRDPKTGQILVEAPLRPHQASDPEEAARIEAAGGWVMDGRIGGRLMLSRSFGDLPHRGVSTDIETFQKDLSADLDAGREVYVCIGSDGLTEACLPHAFARVLNSAVAADRTHRLAEIFATHAYQSGSTDNITAVVTRLPKRMEETVAVAIFDGHGGYQTAEAAQQSFAKKLELPLSPQP